MEQDHPGGVVPEQAEVQGGVDLGWEEWVVPGLVQVRVENVSALNAELLPLMRLEAPVL